MELLAQSDWNGYGGVGEYSNSNGNTYEVMTEAHKSAIMSLNRYPPTSPIRVKCTIA